MFDKAKNFLETLYPDIELKKENYNNIDYLANYGDKIIAVVINSSKTSITERDIKTLGRNLNKFYNQNKNTTFYYFIENQDQLKGSGYHYLEDDMCLLNYVDVIKGEKIKKKKNDVEAKKEKGDNYEKTCGRAVEQQDYIIKYNGIENGVKDNSIDIIAINKEYVLLIQCKDWSLGYCKENGYLSKSNFESFSGQCDDFVRNNKVYQDFKILKYWFVSDIRSVDTLGLKYAHEFDDFILEEIKNEKG